MVKSILFLAWFGFSLEPSKLEEKIEQIEGKEIEKRTTEEIEIEKIRQRYCEYVGYCDKICEDLKKENRENKKQDN